jgi:hypothetical protein
MGRWVIPYVDQPLDFWEEVAAHFGPAIREVYFPVPGGTIASGRSRQPDSWLPIFLRQAPLPKGVLINPIVLPQPAEDLANPVCDLLRRLRDDYGVVSATVTHPGLAQRIKTRLPEIRLTASTLMGIATPAQALMVRDWVDAITPDNRLVRDLAALRRLRRAFSGELRLLVNEACIPGCPFRIQHFYEMGYGQSFPRSLCQALLQAQPWLQLSGAWILPRHLEHYSGLYDTLKLAGRVTLCDRTRYLTVLDAYVHRRPLLPRDIGGGPASVLDEMDISDELFEFTLHCDRNCHTCSRCREYYRQHHPI